jgi:hypothetical protein
MPDYLQVTTEVPDNAGWVGVIARQPVTELKVLNMVADNGRIVAYVGDYQIALTPQMWDVLLDAVLESCGPTRTLKIDFDDANRTAKVVSA